MVSQSKAQVALGHIGAPYGLKGWVKIHSDTEPSANIFNYQPWQLAKEGVDRTVQVLASRLHNSRLLAQLEGCHYLEQARMLTSSVIIITPSQLPSLSPDEYYWANLEGLQVYTCEGIYLGLVDHLLATGANDVLVVQGEKRHMIPFLTDQVIKKIELKQQTITVDWDPNF